MKGLARSAIEVIDEFKNAGFELHFTDEISSIFFHEQPYRTDTVMALKDYRVTICGAGALGGNLTENLARASFSNRCCGV